MEHVMKQKEKHNIDYSIQIFTIIYETYETVDAI